MRRPQNDHIHTIDKMTVDNMALGEMAVDKGASYKYGLLTMPTIFNCIFCLFQTIQVPISSNFFYLVHALAK